MGLLTDSFFIRAIRSNAEILAMLSAGDIYNNVADPDIDMENVELPYIIVNNDGGSEGDMTKDSCSESPEDKVNISVLMVCRSRQELADMTLAVRKTISDFMKSTWQRIEAGTPEEGDEIAPVGYNFSFSDIAYIIEKPAHRQMFYYDCVTPNEIYIDDEQEG